jgi:TolB-like protein/Tfp pilus assembly protein PilF
MKRCPECRRDYYDDSLQYCLDDGSSLLEGPAVGPGTDYSQHPTIAASQPMRHTDEDIRGARTEVLPSVSVAPPKPSKRGAKWPLALALALLATAVVAGGFFYFRSAARPIGSLAVMPFANETGDPDAEYLSDGLTETLIESLTEIPNLNVKSRSSVFRYKGTSEAISKIADDLGVEAILTGRVVKRGADVILYLEVVESRTENVLWKSEYKRAASDLVSLQDEVARSVSQRLRVTISDPTRARSTRTSTTDSRAYELYLMGRYSWNKRTEPEIRRSIDLFQQAIAIDPGFAQAYTGLADSYAILSYYSGIPPQETFPKARAAAEKALEIDPTSGVARADVAYVKFNYEWDFAGAEQDFEKAIELAPSDPTVHFWFAECLIYVGKYDRGLEEMRRARDLDPFSVVYNSNLGWAYYIGRDPDRAIEQLKKTVDLDPNSAMTLFYSGMAFEQKGLADDAVAAYRRSADLSGGFPGLVGLGHVYAATGKRGEALKVLKDMENRSAKGSPISPTGFAIVYAGLNDRDKAFEWLEKARVQRDESILYLKCQPYFDTLRSDPRYDAMLRKIGLS